MPGIWHQAGCCIPCHCCQPGCPQPNAVVTLTETNCATLDICRTAAGTYVFEQCYRVEGADPYCGWSWICTDWEPEYGSTRLIIIEYDDPWGLLGGDVWQAHIQSVDGVYLLFTGLALPVECPVASKYLSGLFSMFGRITVDNDCSGCTAHVTLAG